MFLTLCKKETVKKRIDLKVAILLGAELIKNGMKYHNEIKREKPVALM